MRDQRKIIIGAFTALVIFAAVVAALLRFEFYQNTGHWFPIKIVDVLHSPSAVCGWSEDGLRLTDGRVLQLPNFLKLPQKSTALTEATKRGIEIAPDGRVYGLVRVHHWCNRDPVREQIARVDVADMLMYLREGEWSGAPSDEALDLVSLRPGGTFSKWGWETSGFLGFKHWTITTRWKSSARGPRAY